MTSTATPTSTSSSAAASSSSSGSCGATLYDIPVQDASCATSYGGNHTAIMSACCGSADVVAYADNCGLYCLAEDQTVSDLSECMFDQGAARNDVFCRGAANATASATASDGALASGASVVASGSGSASTGASSTSGGDGAGETGGSSSSGAAAAGPAGVGLTVSGLVVSGLLFSSVLLGALQL